VEAQLAQVIETLKAKVSSLDESNADLAIQLLARRRELSNRARALGQLNATGKRIRIHGDYHLGQTLRTPADGKKSAGDFVILDFEGEPARSLVERRQKQSPLKDVAGMIRSFSYAAYSGLDRYLTDNAGSDAERARSWARCWENLATVEFLRSYTGTMAAKPELLPSLEQAEPLLDAYILEKALYELLYELNNRPQWLRIPFAGILAL
jgi:maltose alpha-D-glucosyltransferase/alpha-amylase